MQTKAENLLNPHRYHLSEGAKKRLRWLYVLYEECGNNVKQAANKIGISRQWLSTIKSIFERNHRDPRSLEPESRAPDNTSQRKRITQKVEDKIIEIRDKRGWGERKISKVLWRDYGLKASPPTVNRYLHKHLKISPRISAQAQDAWRAKKEREKEKEINLKIKYRPPSRIKDYRPGALVEKDIKLVSKSKGFPSNTGGYKIKDYFFFQHSFLDSFTRIKGMDLSEEPSSEAAAKAYQEVKRRMGLTIATINTDNGGENEKNFSLKLNQDNVIQFWSKTATPTDNPRVERSHLTDDKEFYSRQNIYPSFKEQKLALEEWERTYNFVRPHQALGYLTPMEFYQLWKENPEKAHQIVKKYRSYLRRQRERLAQSRKMKNKEQIEKLMEFIDAKLNKKVDLDVYKLDLIKCQLCS